MNTKLWRAMGVIGFLLILTITGHTQNEFAATLEVINGGVSVQRVNTSNFIDVAFEAIVGVGDTIRTDEAGEARVTFFADGTDVTIESDTEYRIVEFQGEDEDFQLRVEVVTGQAVHRLNRALGTNSSYNVETPGMTLAARGTVFAIRVEADGRSGMIVSEGTVDAETDGSDADVPTGFGVRSAVNDALSDVVRATSFDELDAALDGCIVTVTTPDDVSLNVRSGPTLEQEIIGFVDASTIDTFFGVDETGAWYRIEFEDAFGWILSTTATIEDTCAGLRVFESTHSEGDDTSSATITPEATSEPDADGASSDSD